MNDVLMVLLIIIGTGAVIMLIKYIIYRLFDKGADAIRNKMADKKNRENPGAQNLADKYKDEIPQANVEPEPLNEEDVTPEEVEKTVEETTEEDTFEEPVNTDENNEE